MVLIVSLLYAIGLYLAFSGIAQWSRESEEFLDPVTATVFQTGLQLGMGFVLLFVTLTATPLLWRQTASPRLLRLLALIASLNMVVGLFLLFPPPLPMWPFAGVLAIGVSAMWWRWQSRWRGTGVAPSALSGVLRPRLRAGQIWFAFIKGEQETKVRPVLVMKATGKQRWLVAYFTTQEPPAGVAGEYLSLSARDLRGMDRQQWLRCADLRALQRNQLRTYVGIAPTALYQDACTNAGVSPDPLTRTLDEVTPGGDRGPFERALRQSLGVYRIGEPRKTKDDDREVSILAAQTVGVLWRRSRK